MRSNVIMEDGTETDLAEHLRDLHQKGTKGFKEDYLARLHEALHQSKRDPLPEHSHLDMADGAPVAAAIPHQRSGPAGS